MSDMSGNPLRITPEDEQNWAEIKKLQARVEELEAEVAKLIDALDKALPAGTWFHLGPYGASPEKEDYEYACEVFREAKKAERVRNGK